MRKFWTLLCREVAGYFYSPIAYIVLVLFTFLTAFPFVFLEIPYMVQRPMEATAQEVFFNSVFFWLPFVLIFPLITMRSFAEEFKLGTIEPLMTAPVRDWQVVISKFLGAFVFYVALLIPTLACLLIFQKIAHQPAANSMGALWGSYLILLLLGMFYVSIGCLASVLTGNQIVAAVISFVVIAVLFFVGLIQYVFFDISSATRDFLGYFSAIEHVASYSRGIIDTRPVVLYFTLTALVLMFTHQAFQSRKWRL